MTNVATIRRSYTPGGNNVDTTTWVALTMQLPDGSSVTQAPADVASMEIFDSSGRTMELGVGASGSQTRAGLIPPGGNTISLSGPFSKGTQFWLRAVSATATAGEISVNLYHGRR